MPLDGGLLYAEPVYVRGSGLKYPLLRKVLVTFEGRTAFENTLGEALDKVFGTKPTTTTPPDTGTTKPPQSNNPTVQQALNDAQKAFDAGQEALKKADGPDWDAYAKAQQELRDALKRAQDAQSKAADKNKGGDKNSDKSGS